MRFDLFYEMAMPPHLARTESEAYRETLDEIALADQLGFGCAWFVEHHFMRAYSHMSKPELMLAALSQRTSRIHLGHAVIPLPLHHPVHIAERIATLDVLSNGRIEVGIGRGFSPKEFAVFGSQMSDSRALVNDAIAILKASFSKQPVSYASEHFTLDNCDILPHVVQQPHPPLWSAAVSPDSFTWAAEQGMPVMVGPFKPWIMVKRDIEKYKSAWKGEEQPKLAMTVGILCLEDGKQARRIAEQAITWFYEELFKTTLPVLERLYPSYEHFHDLGRFRKLIKMGINLRLLETLGMVVVGTPDECIRKLKKYQKAGVTHLMCGIGAGAVETSMVKESMRCIAEKVMPAFSE